MAKREKILGGVFCQFNHQGIRLYRHVLVVFLVLKNLDQVDITTTIGRIVYDFCLPFTIKISGHLAKLKGQEHE